MPHWTLNDWRAVGAVSCAILSAVGALCWLVQRIRQARVTTPWRAEWRCIKCDGVLYTIDRHFSDGVCPHCGRKSMGHVCDARRVAWRLVDGKREEESE